MSYKIKNKKLTICETFVGCGGGYLGFKNNGFESIFVNDIWQDSLDTLQHNNNINENKIICSDIRDLNCDELMKKYKFKKIN